MTWNGFWGSKRGFWSSWGNKTNLGFCKKVLESMEMHLAPPSQLWFSKRKCCLWGGWYQSRAAGAGLIPGTRSPQSSVIWPFPSLVGTEITEFIYSCGLRAPMLLECDVSMETDRDALDLCAHTGRHQEIRVAGHWALPGREVRVTITIGPWVRNFPFIYTSVFK